ncbi:response regulator transcription factor [Sulfurospirillum barnesii]|uniref:Response regulator with CheY-like receiver domain and winged-helix DNA-binding domain n=1 Tax=Sulfurospirillum barnesii (strain ATCC 700032 / DSM 10660 / SES-3) TaxID=760154 RepID=I3XWG8_SULBS|nr:response regulator transcription factor [Sulfurospirillum barnesii]AFL68292.1 response regulator with CheY-like receiver domain and winged-helix DNA-binding domain [Sulfurospirillum barnesii SES-3]
MQKKIKVLLIEDDTDAAKEVVDFLENVGFELTVAETAVEGLTKLATQAYELLLLDLSLPDFSGFEVIKQINNQNSIPIIVLSCHTNLDAKIKAFRFGVDDYLCKPFMLEELEVRMWAILKRCSMIKFEASQALLSMDYKNQTISLNNTPLPLTAIEYKILAFLIENKNRVVYRDVLAIHLSSLSSRQSLNYHIQNIRKKLGDSSKKPKFIMTEYGTGYRLVM